jgi:hypothetical protein
MPDRQIIPPWPTLRPETDHESTSGEALAALFDRRVMRLRQTWDAVIASDRLENVELAAGLQALHDLEDLADEIAYRLCYPRSAVRIDDELESRQTRYDS